MAKENRQGQACVRDFPVQRPRWPFHEAVKGKKTGLPWGPRIVGAARVATVMVSLQSNTIPTKTPSHGLSIQEQTFDEHHLRFSLSGYLVLYNREHNILRFNQP